MEKKHWTDQNPVRSKASLKEQEDEQITLCVRGLIPTLNNGLYFEKIKIFVFDLILMASWYFTISFILIS